MLRRYRRPADHSYLLHRLASAYTDRWNHLHKLGDLETAIQITRQLTDEAHSADWLAFSDYGELSLMHYQETEEPGDLDTAVHYLERAIQLTPADEHCFRLQRIQMLGRTLIHRSGERSNPDDLERAVSLLTQAVQEVRRLPEIDDDDLPALLLSTLADGYWRRYQATFADEDRSRLIETLDQATVSQPSSVHQRLLLWRRALLLLERAVGIDDEATLDAAISDLESAFAEGLPLGNDPAGVQNLLALRFGLAHALAMRFHTTRSGRDAERARALLTSSAESSAAKAAPSSPSYSLAATVLLLLTVDGDEDTLEEALHLAEKAYRKGAEGAPLLRAHNALILAGIHQERYVRLSDAEDQRAAREYCRQVLDFADIAPALALAAAAALGQLETTLENWPAAATVLDRAMDISRRLYEAQVFRDSKEHLLSRRQVVPVLSAYAHARMGDATSAAVRLEEGRAVLLSEALEYGRAAMDHLSSAGHAVLAQRYQQAATRVRALERDADIQRLEMAMRPELFLEPGPVASVKEITQARSELDAVLAQIRKVKGFSDFLRRPHATDLTAAIADASKDTPMVYLASFETEGFAVIARGAEAVDVKRLPGMTDAAVAAIVDSHLTAYRERKRAPARWWTSLTETNTRIGELIMSPLLAELGDVPQVTLIPTGLLGLLPLHAATLPTTGADRYALDTTLITYAPNARTIARPPAENAASILIIDDPRPDSDPVPFAGPEADIAEQAFTHVTRLSGASATRDAVLEHLSRHAVVHFATHGRADLTAPLNSGLQLSGDAEITVADLLAVDLTPSRLAVLSACETAIPGLHLPDEVVGLPAGLLQAGFTGVAATMWAVGDVTTALVISQFYAELAAGYEPAEALRLGQTWVRDSTNGEKHANFPTIYPRPNTLTTETERDLWENAHSYTHPVHWAGFAFFGC
ncbi:CHAT domain-containing protein [Streptomyces antibioticus]|uniref:CHAT domain-containing protein n=1 Tax=Streptomyces antibioticus TaxID=1890 RepID=UPI00367D1260